MFATLRRYLPSPPGASRQRFEELSEEIRQIRLESRSAQDKLAERLAPIARMGEHLPLLRRELDDFVQSLSVTLRQASERMRELDDRIEALLEHSRIQTDALGAIQTSVLASHEDQSRSSLPVPISRGRELNDHLDQLRAATDRLSHAAGRSEELLAGLSATPQAAPAPRDPTRLLAAVAIGTSGLALLAVAVALVALLS